MPVSIQISVRGVELPEKAKERIQKHAEELGKLYPRMTSCKVVVESPTHRHKKGNLFYLRITISMPRKELVVNREPSKRHSHEEIQVAIRDAFNEARRQLKDFVSKQRG